VPIFLIVFGLLGTPEARVDKQMPVLVALNFLVRGTQSEDLFVATRPIIPQSDHIIITKDCRQLQPPPLPPWRKDMPN
jgi:hypothetical protein